MLTLNKVLLVKIEENLFKENRCEVQTNGDTYKVPVVKFDGINPELLNKIPDNFVKPDIIRQSEIKMEPITTSNVNNQVEPSATDNYPIKEEYQPPGDLTQGPPNEEIVKQEPPQVEVHQLSEQANINQGLPILSNIIVEDAIPDKKYKIETNDNSIIKLRPNYSTDNEGEKKLVDLINNQDETGWNEAINKNNIRIITKNVEGSESLLLKTFAEIPYPLTTIIKAINSIDLRKQWDKGFSDFECLESSKEGDVLTEIVYSIMKFPFPFSNRDWVQKKTFWEHYGGNPRNALFHYVSVEHPEKPEKSSPVRAEMIIGGQFLTEVQPGLTKLYMINHADPKMGKALQGTVNKKAPESPKDFVTNLIKGCQLVK